MKGDRGLGIRVTGPTFTRLERLDLAVAENLDAAADFNVEPSGDRGRAGRLLR
jgi:hypothetical protein